jgi:deoxycytidine triphosphate deaminase
MGFITIEKVEQLTGSATILEPLEDSISQKLPTVWFDLHVSGDHYYTFAKPRVQRSFRKGNEGEAPFLRIPPRQGVRLISHESVAVDNEHIGFVTNVASRAIEGLIVAPGKIDPGFGKQQLALVVFNQSTRTVRVRAGDKIAALAFIQVSSTCMGRGKPGYAGRAVAEIEPGIITKVCDVFLEIARHPLVTALAGGLVGALVMWFLQGRT